MGIFQPHFFCKKSSNKRKSVRCRVRVCRGGEGGGEVGTRESAKAVVKCSISFENVYGLGFRLGLVTESNA